MSKRELAEKVRISPAAITLWKTRDCYPTADKLKLICEALEISADELLEIDLSPPDKPPEIKLTHEEKQLLQNYRISDERGKENILDMSEKEASRGHPEIQKLYNSLIG